MFGAAIRACEQSIFRLSAIGRMERSTVLLSSSMRPSTSIQAAGARNYLIWAGKRRADPESADSAVVRQIAPAVALTNRGAVGVFRGTMVRRPFGAKARQPIDIND
jgi:hypothetical protein